MSRCLIALIGIFYLAGAPAALAGERADHFAGEIESFTTWSEELQQEREVLVALPDRYEPGNERYPVLYVLDADWHFLPAVAAVRFLAETSYISAHRVPRMIVVGVPSIDRNYEYTPTHSPAQHGMSFPTSGGADQFLAFLEKELVPRVDESYRTEPYRVLAGWSFGGLFTMHALLDHPDLFGGYLAISPSLWWDEQSFVERGIELAGTGRRERDLILTIGTGEEGGLCYEAVHRLDDAWSENPLPGLSYSFVEIEGEDHNHGPYKAYFDGLRSLFADWFYPEEVFAAGLDSMRLHYGEMSRRRGYEIGIPDHLYSALARTMVSEGRPAEAIAVLEDQCRARPEEAMAQFDLGEICRKADAPARARQAYARALELERALAEPDTVFINWVEGLLTGLDGE